MGRVRRSATLSSTFWRGDRRREAPVSATAIDEDCGRIGLSVVMNRCIQVEHARYVGRMHWLGFNPQRITSERGGLQ